MLRLVCRPNNTKLAIKFCGSINMQVLGFPPKTKLKSWYWKLILIILKAFLYSIFDLNMMMIRIHMSPPEPFYKVAIKYFGWVYIVTVYCSMFLSTCSKFHIDTTSLSDIKAWEDQFFKTNLEKIFQIEDLKWIVCWLLVKPFKIILNWSPQLKHSSICPKKS